MKPLFYIGGIAAAVVFGFLFFRPTVAAEPVFASLQAESPTFTDAGLNLMLDYEVGGEWQYKKWPHPEYGGGSYSGVTWGIGYDAHQNRRDIIVEDWKFLGTALVQRLANTQPYVGSEARSHVKDVVDIIVPWESARDVFVQVDLMRTDSICKRVYPGFEKLKPTARDALRSLTFNRGGSMIGDNRREMREIQSLCPKADYNGMAAQLRAMTRIWIGTGIERGMRARREAEARLMEL